MKTTLIATCLNEESTVEDFIESIFSQTMMPDEIIIVDGGSYDKTLQKIRHYKKVKIYRKNGNRSVGRNYAISKSKGDVILCTDLGCVLDKNWVKNISKPFKDPTVGVVAGYYKGRGKTVFQKCIVPFILVMPDRLNKAEFLPASRSMAFRKKVWDEVGGFSKEYSHNEDYVFSKNIKKNNFKIVFVSKAIVYWIPRKDIFEAFIMFFRFAYGDAQAGIYRKKVILIFVRYAIGLTLLILATKLNSAFLYMFAIILLISYIAWAIKKNFKFAKFWLSLFILPALQFISDLAVIFGTSLGFLQRKASK